MIHCQRLLLFATVLLYQVHAVYGQGSVFDFLLVILAGECSAANDERCGFFNLGYVIQDSSGQDAICTDRCSYWPVLDVNYVCEKCPPSKTQPTDGFFIALDYADSVPFSGTDRAIFKSARDTWESVVVGDLPDVPRSELTLAANSGCSYPDPIDDLHICCLYEKIDGKAGVLGIANWRERRPDGLPMTGRIRMDSDDTERLKSSDRLKAVIEHEIAHILGIGLLWEEFNLVEKTRKGWEYIGEKAVDEYNAVSGCSAIPTDDEHNHWSEDCLRNELLTSDIVDNNNILSYITVASLEDMGYEVNYGPAEEFTVFNIDSDCMCSRRQLRTLQQDEDQPRRPQLSGEGLQNAIRYGQQVLAEDQSEFRSGAFINDVVSVLYEEDGTIFSVTVR